MWTATFDVCKYDIIMQITTAKRIIAAFHMKYTDSSYQVYAR
jgi:hypothetical protein